MMPSESGAESLEQPAAQVGTGAASAVATAGAAGGGPDPETSSASLGRHQSRLNWPQVKRLDALLKEPIPIHGRGNFPTLSVQPQQIVQVRGGALAGSGVGWCSAPRQLESVTGPAARETKERELGLTVRLFLHPAELACPPFWGPLIPLGNHSRPWLGDGVEMKEGHRPGSRQWGVCVLGSRLAFLPLFHILRPPAPSGF